jgi:hypothetical protein
MCSAYNIPLPEGEVLNNQAENLPNNFNHNQDCFNVAREIRQRIVNGRFL